MVKKSVIIVVSLIIFLLIFNYMAMPWYVRHSKLNVVPNVTGLQFNDAKRILEDAGLNVKQGDVRYDDTKPIGIILEQNPPADQTVKSGRRVYLVVCGGEQMVEVPKLSGRSMRDAKFTLEQRGLELGEVVKKFSNQFPEEYVINQVIQPRSKVKKSTKIDVIVSNGPQIGNIIIPDLVGKTLDDAKRIILERRLKLGKVTYQPSDLPAGQVVDQYPKKEKSALENTAVDLFVTKKRPKTEIFEDDEMSPENGKPGAKEPELKMEDKNVKEKTEKPKEKQKPVPENK
ncbi:MAG: PASTA domain-containing protein [Ignavibacteria bacterium]|nr:PASTA domain-containing protein [Ignavibacteria bacterium]